MENFKTNAMQKKKTLFIMLHNNVQTLTKMYTHKCTQRQREKGESYYMPFPNPHFLQVLHLYPSLSAYLL